MNWLKMAIEENDIDLLDRCDVSTKRELCSVNSLCFLNFDVEASSYYGAIGYALFCKADLSIFRSLVDRGAPLDNVFHSLLNHNTSSSRGWYSAVEAARYLKLDQQIVNLLLCRNY